MISKISDKDYHAMPHLSSSAIKSFLKSPKNYHHEYVLGNKTEPTQSMIFGTAFHELLLLNKKPIIKPEVDGRTKEGKIILSEFNEKNKNEGIIISKHEAEYLD
jgi:hypothetical protein